MYMLSALLLHMNPKLPFPWSSAKSSAWRSSSLVRNRSGTFSCSKENFAGGGGWVGSKWGEEAKREFEWVGV